MKRKIRMAALILTASMAVQTTVPAAGLEMPKIGGGLTGISTEITAALKTAEQQKTSVKVKPGWVKKSGKYYWRQANGEILKKAGPNTLNGKKYYLNKDGSRVEDAWKKIHGKLYYFQKNGLMYQKKGWFVNGKYKYYINSDGSCMTGFHTIRNRLHYFDARGRIYCNKRAVKIEGKYYDVDAKCNVKQISAVKAKCILETRKFIEQHTNSSMSNSQKFRACYNYLLWYMNYYSRPYEYSDFKKKDWQYQWAYDVYATGLRGDCFGFACCVAACAAELGYEPYVVVTTGDHGFVMIDGLYYDNMGALFGSYSHFAYNTYCKVKF